MGIQEWTIKRNWQHLAHKTQTTTNKTKNIYSQTYPCGHLS